LDGFEKKEEERSKSAEDIKDKQGMTEKDVDIIYSITIS